MSPTFDDLVAEAAAAPVEGWDFSWLDGRATEERPSWGYQRLLSRRLARASAAVDLQTGGGEVLAGTQRHGDFTNFPPTMAATEAWPPNAARATTLLHPRGVVVVTVADDPPLPFADEAFDLVSSRHPNSVCWDEVARVLAPGGTYLAQLVIAPSALELVEYFLGPQPQPQPHSRRRLDDQTAQAGAAGLQIVAARMERLRLEFFDVGAVIYFLRKVIWAVPGFTVHGYRARLRELHELIQADGPFVAHSARALVEARKPGPGQGKRW
jgi:SAM-dependent methyltransferase